MDSDFINNLYALVMDSEGNAWNFRNKQDPDNAVSKVTLQLMKRYRDNILTKIPYSDKGAYSGLDPQHKAMVDLYIMDNLIKSKAEE